MYRKGKDKKRYLAACFCLCSFCFWREVSNSWILNDIGKNLLLESRKKIAKCIMRTFTCSSTFLYGWNTHCINTARMGLEYRRFLPDLPRGVRPESTFFICRFFPLAKRRLEKKIWPFLSFPLKNHNRHKTSEPVFKTKKCGEKESTHKHSFWGLETGTRTFCESTPFVSISRMLCTLTFAKE